MSMSCKTLKVLENLELVCNTNIENLEEIKKTLKEAYQNNKKFFKSDTPLITITLVYTRKELDEIIHRQTKDWEVAYAYNHDDLKNQIVIFSPEIIETVSGNTKSYFPYLLTHEMAHVFTDNVRNFFQPRWLYEGLAGYVSKQYSKAKKITKIVEFKQIHDKKGWNEYPSYAQAYSFTKFLVDKYGEKKLLDFLVNHLCKLDRYNKYGEFKLIFEKFFDEDIESVSNSWITSVIS